KSMDLDKLVINDEIIDYVMAKYGNKWQVGDDIADVILDDLLQKEFNKQERVKDDKRKAILKGSDDQRIVLKINQGQALKIFKVKKLQASNFQKLNRSSSKSLPVKKPPNSKHLTPKTGSSSKPYSAKLTSSSKDLQADVGASARSFTLLVPTKKPLPIMNCILGLLAVRIRGLILNKEFGIRKPKEVVIESANVTSKGKRKMV
ncbi:hypothetical protein Tco_0000126, partial [Tanacetum coccineum]